MLLDSELFPMESESSLSILTLSLALLLLSGASGGGGGCGGSFLPLTPLANCVVDETAGSPTASGEPMSLNSCLAPFRRDVFGVSWPAPVLALWSATGVVAADAALVPCCASMRCCCCRAATCRTTPVYIHAQCAMAINSMFM